MTVVVESVEIVEADVDVCDLTVEGDHSFVVHGAVLHNCPQCMALDGKVFDIGKGPRPAFHLNCRCSTSPVLKSARELGLDIEDFPEGTRASMGGQVPSTLRYPEWLKKQSVEIQDEALGPRRGALFRKGELKVSQFTNRRGRTLTLKELRQREPDAFREAGLL